MQLFTDQRDETTCLNCQRNFNGERGFSSNERHQIRVLALNVLRLRHLDEFEQIQAEIGERVRRESTNPTASC